MLKHLFHFSWWLGLSLYLGGMVALAVIAPTVFYTTAQSHISMPGIAAPPLQMDKEVGGEIFGAALNQFAWIEQISLVLMLAGLAHKILPHKPAPHSAWALFALWLVLLIIATYDHASLRPTVWATRAQVRAAAPAHTDPQTPFPEQAEFTKLHARSELLGRTKVYLLLAILIVASRPPKSKAPPS